MQHLYLVIIYFFYGLSFFSMGLLVTVEGGRSSDERLRKALRPLAGFGLVHAAHEWLEMLGHLGEAVGVPASRLLQGLALTTLAFSFLSLAAFGSYLLAKDEIAQRISLMVPLGLEAVWVFGLAVMKGHYPLGSLQDAAEAWTRYTLAIPSSLLAAVGLIAQQRAFRRAGLIRFGQDSLWAAIAFGWYGLVGQLFIRPSLLPPSTFVNEDLFLQIFGFPIQLLRAVAAIGAAFFVIRFLRAFQVEMERKIADLQAERLKESQQRETLRTELFRRVVAAQEAERRRIARDLHDETGQSLTAIGMGLRGLTSSLRNTRNKQAFETLHHLESMTADSLRELQRLITDLRPSHLDDLGLPAALRWYAGKIQERHALNVRVDISGEEQPMDEAAKIATFRIVQEALNNIIKHAEASYAQIELTYKSDGMYVSVRDDGAGFDLDRVKLAQSSRPSLGLAGMQERAALLGGMVAIQSGPGQGTLVEAYIPYHQRPSEVNNDHTPALGR